MSIPSEFTSPADLATAGLMDGTKWNAFRNWLKRSQQAAATVSKDGSTYYAYKANGELIQSSGTDAGIVVNDACSFVGTIGGMVKINAATYSVLTTILQPSNVIISGQARQATKLISTSALATNMIRNSDETNGNTGLSVEHLYLDHSAATGGVALKCTKVSQSRWYDNFITGNSTNFAAYWTAGTSTANDNLIMDNIFDGGGINGGDVFGGGKLTDSVVAFNRVQNSSATGGGIVQRLPLRTLFIGNETSSCNNGGISLETGQYCMVIGNSAHDNNGPGLSCGTSADGDPIGNSFIGNKCINNNLGTSTGRGIAATGTEMVIIGNTCNGNNGPGIEFTGDDSICSNNFCKNNGKLTSLADHYQSGIRIANAQDSIVTGNRCFDDSTGTQLTGIYEIGTSDFNTITNNSVRGNATIGIVIIGADTICRNNVGFKTEAKGTSTILSGTTLIAVTHGLSYTPTAAEIGVTFTENPTVTPGMWWPSAIGATTFTVNVENDPTTSNLDFSWRVIRI